MLKSFPKILTIAFLIIFIFQLIGLIFIFTLPTVSQAAPAEFTPQVEIPGFKFNSKANDTSNIAELIKAIYIYAIGIVGILAAVVLMIGGVMWIIAGGNATAIGEAKAWIGASLTGLVLALSSYLILATVNPALVDFRTSQISTVEKMISNDRYCCDPIKGQIAQTVTTVGDQQQFDCPTGIKSFIPSLANCIKNNGEDYKIVKLKIDCCENSSIFSSNTYSCVDSRTNEKILYDKNYCSVSGKGKQMEDHYCFLNRCIPIEY